MVVLDPESKVAPFEQVRAQIAAAIESGVLQSASRLPTVRALAADWAWPSTPWPGPIGPWSRKGW